MKNTTVLVDTNIFIDIALNRKRYFDSNLKLLNLKNLDKLVISKQIFDIHFILKNKGILENDIFDFLRTIRFYCNILDLNVEDVDKALNNKNMKDFEDAVISARAKRFGADYIITRNVKDFDKSEVKAMTPEDFLKEVKI